MTFSEALEAMKQGYKVRREDWEDGLYRVMAFNSFTIIENSNGENIIAEYVSNILATDWEIYNEPKPEPQFEIGELVMMRDELPIEEVIKLVRVGFEALKAEKNGEPFSPKEEYQRIKEGK